LGGNAVPVLLSRNGVPVVICPSEGNAALQRSCHFGVSDSPETMRQDEWSGFPIM